MKSGRIHYEKLLANLAETDHGVRGLEIHDSLDSTNARILRKPVRQAHGLAVISHEQSDGHGRHGRHWHSPPGGLYLSLGWCLKKQMARPSLLTWVTSSTVMSTLHALGLKDVMIKWPNDICCSGGKLGGVLVEVKTVNSASCLTVIGIGINTQPLDRGSVTDQPVIDLRSLGLTIPPHRLVCSLLSELSCLLYSWQQWSTEMIVKKYQPCDCA